MSSIWTPDEIKANARADPLQVQTLLWQPVRAAETKSLTIHGRTHDPTYGLLDLSIFNDEDWTLVEAALGRVSASDEERAEWLSDIRTGFWDALIALELMLLPNLEKLDFGSVIGSYDDQLKWLKKVMEKVAASQRSSEKSSFLLPKLRDVSLGWWDTENGMDIEHLVDFMSVPSLERLDAFMVESEGWEASPGMSFSVKELKLCLASINSEALRDLIQCCPQLEKLSYEAGGAIVGYSTLIPSVLNPALAALKHCLQELDITEDNDMDWAWEEGDPEAPMASFADFEKLHTLSLRACMLVGKDKHENHVESDMMELTLEDTGPKTAKLVDVVPKSLKKLTLEYCGSGILGQLEELLARKEELTPVLERIEIAIKEDCTIDEEEAQRLAEGFKKSNVDLHMRTC